MTSDRRILLVHAHPDDETINNGVTMAKYAAEGAHVTLLTCTRGEEGEVLVPTWNTWPPTATIGWVSTASRSSPLRWRHLEFVISASWVGPGAGVTRG